MSGKVAIIGIGYTAVRASTPDVSYRELTFEAARAAYADAGISNEDVESAVCCEEDFFEGISITDEYTPDQLGVVLRPVETVTGDGLHGLAVAAMQIQTGAINVAVVEAHSKASNILTFDHIQHFALDPVWNRPLGFPADAVAGLEMRAFLKRSGLTARQCDAIAAENHAKASANLFAAYGEDLSTEQVGETNPTFEPLRAGHHARRADGAVVLVLASEDRAVSAESPVWIRGTGWANDTPTLESRSWGDDPATTLAGAMALRETGAGPADMLSSQN